MPLDVEKRIDDLLDDYVAGTISDRDAMLTLARKIKAKAVTACDNIVSSHFAEMLSLESQNVDASEVAAERGAHQAATECARAIESAIKLPEA